MRFLTRIHLVDAADQTVRTYSGGMRRRLDLAASMVGRPPVLFLDEPTTGVDPRSRLDIWELIEELVEAGTTLLLTTQYLDEAERLAYRIGVIDHGRLIAQGTADELKDQLSGDRVALTVDVAAGAARMAALAELGSPVSTDPREGTLTLPAPDGTADLLAVLRRLDVAGISPQSIELRRPSLDDVFMSCRSRRACSCPLGAQAGSDLEAVEVRQHHIEHDQRRVVVLGCGDRSASGGRLDHLEAFVAQRGGHCVDGRRLIVDDEDALAGIGIKQIFVPGTATLDGWAIGWGVIATYLFAATVFTTWPRRLWRVVHLTSVIATALALLYTYQSGSDATMLVMRIGLLAGIAVATYALGLRLFGLPARRRRTVTKDQGADRGVELSAETQVGLTSRSPGDGCMGSCRQTKHRRRPSTPSSPLDWPG